MISDDVSSDAIQPQPEDILQIDLEQFRCNNFVALLESDLNNNLQQLKAAIPAGLLEVKTANSWIEQASHRPIPRMLFSEFWYEQELCILFADTNVGKTILAVQIADSISRGCPIPGFKLEAQKQKVIYCDFELNDKQFQGRYSRNYGEPYVFSDNIIVCQITKPHNFLHFSFLHFDSEYKHLKTVSERDKEKLEEEIRRCIDEEPSISAYAIAKRLCPEENNFNSFKIKILRIYKKIHPDNKSSEDKTDEDPVLTVPDRSPLSPKNQLLGSNPTIKDLIGDEPVTDQ